MKYEYLNNMKYEIYCDLDGVLADFEKAGKLITGVDIHTQKNEFWKRLKHYTSKGGKVWEDLDFMPDAMTLWNYIKPYNPSILTATGTVGNAREEKKIWVQKNLGNIPTHLVIKGADKAKYAQPHAILIDDRSIAIDPWINNKGIGILHTSAANTIKQLKELGL